MIVFFNVIKLASEFAFTASQIRGAVYSTLRCGLHVKVKVSRCATLGQSFTI